MLRASESEEQGEIAHEPEPQAAAAGRRGRGRVQGDRVTGGDHLGRPPLFVTRQRYVTFLTDAARRIIDESEGLEMVGGTLRARSPGGELRLENLVSATVKASRGEAAFRMRRTHLNARDDGAISISAIPAAPRTRVDDHDKTTVNLQLWRDGAEPASPVSARHLEERYGFTNREARVVQHLLSGKSLRQSAEEVRVAYDTARWYLKGVYRKTHASRQSDLVRKVLHDFAAVLQEGYVSD